MKLFAVSLLVFGCALRASPAFAQCGLGELHAAGGAAGDSFGEQVALDGSRALVGEWRRERAYLLERVGMAWVERQTLVASTGTPGQRFGSSVALCGGTALVGAYQDWTLAGSSGSVHVFDLLPSGWTQTATLRPEFAHTNQFFGFSVALTPDRALIGAPHDESAYVFERDRMGTPLDPTDDVWSQTMQLYYGCCDDYFGYRVALEGDTAVVSAPGVDDYWPQLVNGAVYTFAYAPATGWGPPRKVFAHSLTTGKLELGTSLALSGDRIAAGAPYSGDPDSGAAFVFERDERGTPADPLDDEWVQVAMLETPVPHVSNQFFGYALDLDGDTLVVGEPGTVYGTHGTGSGAAHVYERVGSGWRHTAALRSSDGDLFDGLGTSVALDGANVLVGAPWDDDLALDAGAVHAFVFQVAQSTATIRTGCANPLGFLQLTPPLVGAFWETRVDLAPAGATASVVLIGAGGPTAQFCGLPTNFGDWLILPPFVHGELAAGEHAIPIPNDCGLIGATFWSQAARIGTSIELLNAIDITLGTF